MRLRVMQRLARPEYNFIDMAGSGAACVLLYNEHVALGVVVLLGTFALSMLCCRAAGR